jgi:two-component system sensor histidine kinase VicK
VVVWLSVVVCGACTWLYADYFVRVRFGVIVSAFERIAGGELDLELPPPPDADVAGVRTAMLAMSRALADLTQQLRDADAARRRLFSDLSHELATPSSTIIALVDALATPGLSATEAQRNELVGALTGETARLARLVNDMRDLGQLDDPDFVLERENVELSATVSDVVQRLKLTQLGNRKVEVDAEPATAFIDRERIEQVIVNLLTNAARYAADAGQIRVRVRDDGELARIVVDDAGEGVPSDELKRLGERLLRIDPSRSRKTGGSGLGLSIVRAIVERHGGTVRFGKSALGGLEVTIELPTSAS